MAGQRSRAPWVWAAALLLLLCVAGATGEESSGDGVASKLEKAAEVLQAAAGTGEEGVAAEATAPEVATPADEKASDAEAAAPAVEGTEEAAEDKEAEGSEDKAAPIAPGDSGGDPAAATTAEGDNLNNGFEFEGEMSDERGYFNGLDTDGDGTVSMKEFDGHMKSVKKEMEADGDGLGDGSGAPGKLGRAVGMEWLELHEGDSHQQAFAGVDQNKDGKISWREWVAELFHELPQRPEYMDGELGPVLDASMFKRYDKNEDGFLEKSEIDSFVGKYMRREEVDEIYAGNHEDEVPKDNGNTGYTYLFLFEFDANFDGRVSQQEWTDGFAKEAVGPPEGSILLQ